jgi:hypothetical protein
MSLADSHQDFPVNLILVPGLFLGLIVGPTHTLGGNHVGRQFAAPDLLTKLRAPSIMQCCPGIGLEWPALFHLHKHLPPSHFQNLKHKDVPRHRRGR